MTKPFRLGAGVRPDSHGPERDALPELELHGTAGDDDTVITIRCTPSKGTPVLSIVDSIGSLLALDRASGLSILSLAIGAGEAIFTSVQTTGGATLGGIHVESSAISATLSSLSSPFNDLAPTGGTTTRNIRFSTSGGAVSITSLSLGQIGGRLVRLFNLGPNTITLDHASASGTAANRFLCPGSANFALTVNSGVDVWYDSTSSRWRLVR